MYPGRKLPILLKVKKEEMIKAFGPPPQPQNPQNPASKASKRLLDDSSLHQSFFEALEIEVPKGEGSLRAHFWLVLWRNKEGKVEVMMHVMKGFPSSLSCNGRIKAKEGTIYTRKTARSKLFEETASCISDCLPRHSVNPRSESSIRIEWRWNTKDKREGKDKQEGKDCSILVYT